MLTGMHVVVAGGDLRQVEVIRALSRLDASLYLVGFDQLDNGFLGVEKKSFETLDKAKADAVILPVNGISDNQEIDSVFSGTPQFLKREWLEKMPGHMTLYTGIANNTLTHLAAEANKKLVTLMDRDDLAIYNAIPTAEGAVMLAIQHTNVTIHRSNVVVTGFGRVGQTIARTFSQLGARVTVAAREEALLARAYEMTLNPVHLSELDRHVTKADVVINTIPAPVLSSNIISKMPGHVLILDIASKPGGTDFTFAEKRGIKTILTPGLPGLVAPKTAGKQLAGLLTMLLKKQQEEQEGGRD